MGYGNLLDVIQKQYEEILQVNLVGIYVHGSIAFGCFHWESSDIDFIVVVESSLSRQTKLRLLQVLEDHLTKAPKKGFEMSVVLKQHCRHFVYPTPYELHFSNAWLEQYRNDPAVLCTDNVKTDCDLAAHFTVIRNVGIAWCGRPIAEVFGNIPSEYYLDSLFYDLENASEEIHRNPVYVILNLCRVLAYMTDSVILSKQAGGEWGLKNTSGQYRKLIETALENYAGKSVGMIHDTAMLSAFCTYILKQIFN